MKKLLSLLIVAGMVAFVACGPSQAELEAKRIADSIRVADSVKKVNDSLAEIARQDSIKKAEEAKKIADSLHQDSVKKGLIKVKKTK